MAKIEIGEDLIQIDAAIIATGLKIDEIRLREGMRDGSITSRVERGTDDDAGSLRLTFFSQNRRLRVVADTSGAVLTCNTIDFGILPLPASARKVG